MDWKKTPAREEKIWLVKFGEDVTDPVYIQLQDRKWMSLALNWFFFFSKFNLQHLKAS